MANETLRFECIKLAVEAGISGNPKDIIDAAREFMDFIHDECEDEECQGGDAEGFSKARMAS